MSDKGCESVGKLSLKKEGSISNYTERVNREALKMQNSIELIQSIQEMNSEEQADVDLLASASVCSDILNRTNREIKILQQKA